MGEQQSESSASSESSERATKICGSERQRQNDKTKSHERKAHSSATETRWLFGNSSDRTTRRFGTDCIFFCQESNHYPSLHLRSTTFVPTFIRSDSLRPYFRSDSVQFAQTQSPLCVWLQWETLVPPVGVRLCSSVALLHPWQLVADGGCRRCDCRRDVFRTICVTISVTIDAVSAVSAVSAVCVTIAAVCVCALSLPYGPPLANRIGRPCRLRLLVWMQGRSERSFTFQTRKGESVRQGSPGVSICRSPRQVDEPVQQRLQRW